MKFSLVIKDIISFSKQGNLQCIRNVRVITPTINNLMCIVNFHKHHTN